jgi:hypothetical protein
VITCSPQALQCGCPGNVGRSPGCVVCFVESLPAKVSSGYRQLSAAAFAQFSRVL